MPPVREFAGRTRRRPIPPLASMTCNARRAQRVGHAVDLTPLPTGQRAKRLELQPVICRRRRAGVPILELRGGVLDVLTLLVEELHLPHAARERSS